MSRIPGPGKLFAIPAAMRLLADPRALIAEYTRRHGPVWRMAMPDGAKLVDLVWLLGPDGNERILAPQHKADFTWAGGYRFTMEPIFGRDILLLKDDAPGCPAHRDRHRQLVWAFHPRMDPDYIAAIGRIVGARAAGWRDGAQLDLAAELKAIAFHVVANLLLGADDRELPALHHLFEEIGQGLYAVFKVRAPGFRFFRGVRARRALSARLGATVARYRREGLPSNMLGGLMRALDEQGERLPDESLVSEMISFLFAGYDTTASLLASLFVCLAERPDVAEKMAGEAASLAAPSFQAMGELPWSEAAFLEAERLHPPLVFNLRGVERGFEHRGFAIARGSKVAYSSWWTGRMPELFPEPERFRPERFMGGERPPPYSLLGFGGGHRACIGKRFAALEMRLVVSWILSRFRVEPAPDQSDEVFFNPAMQRRHGFRVTLRAR
jgi:cytochrome P450